MRIEDGREDGLRGRRLAPGRVEEAARAIDPVFLRTPQYESGALDDELGARVVVKVESANPIRSFKGRGTDRLVGELVGGGGRVRRLVCASAGNFGQGLAYAARKRGIPLTVFAARHASTLKVEAMRALGAEVRLDGDDFDAAKDAARLFAEANAANGYRFVEDGREAPIAEGAGTIAAELCRWPEAFDAVVVPLGNGSLLSGVGAYFKAFSPGTKVVGVCAGGAPAMALSLRAGRPVSTPSVRTIADGIAVRVPVPDALEDLEGVVDEVLLVDDAAMIRAMRLAFSSLGLVVEPAGAAGLAAILEHGERFRGKLLATPLCGGNLTEEQAKRWLLGAS